MGAWPQWMQAVAGNTGPRKRKACRNGCGKKKRRKAAAGKLVFGSPAYRKKYLGK